MQPIWQALYDYGADVVLSGHIHNYERFAKQTPAGVADPVRGIREFVGGTGGKSHYAINTTIPNSEANNDDTYGVLKLTLHASSYDWEFVPVAGGTFTDAGSDVCFAGPSAVGGATVAPDGLGRRFGRALGPFERFGRHGPRLAHRGSRSGGARSRFAGGCAPRAGLIIWCYNRMERKSERWPCGRAAGYS